MGGLPTFAKLVAKQLLVWRDHLISRENDRTNFNTL
jgi:hypothetical protein